MTEDRAMAKKPGRKVPRRRTCGAMAVHNRLVESDPGYRARLAALETTTSARLATAFAAPARVTIPVVVHVVYRTAAENISTAQVRSQIAALNKDYSATNPDKTKTPAVWAGLVSDTRVQFKLAKKDPSGKKTSGITRTETEETAFTDDDAVKFKATGGAGAWPSSKYLNIWVCTLADQLLGYAQFPGGPAKTDGVVILNTAFGTTGTAKAPFNLGRTTTHEVGHWLNLRHIWGDTEDCSGSDFVADTPNAAGPNYGKPRFPHVTCTNGPNGDLFVNYMDYVDDKAMVMFTSGQVVRMRTVLDGPRRSLAASGKRLTK
jgi:hypothetical protein